MNAATDLLPEAPPELPLGVGVHTGTTFVGLVGEGDAVNATARLSGLAAAGELLVSAAAAEAAGLDTTGLEHRCLELRSREETLDAWVAQPARPAGSIEPTEGQYPRTGVVVITAARPGDAGR